MREWAGGTVRKTVWFGRCSPSGVLEYACNGACWHQLRGRGSARVGHGPGFRGQRAERRGAAALAKSDVHAWRQTDDTAGEIYEWVRFLAAATRAEAGGQSAG